jgi:hypothetical protein
MTTRVVNMHHEPFDVLIQRPSCWGNPFRIPQAGSREDVIFLYELLIRTRPDFITKIKQELRGKRLGCGCKPKACHGDVLAKIADKP